MRALLAASLAVFALVGCARGPKNGGVGQYTRLQFRFRFDGPVVTGDPLAFTSGYIYVVAIRPLLVTDPVDDGFGPVPVYAATNGIPKNGFVEGRPTRYVVYNPAAGTLYQIKGFNPRNPSPDDDNPIDLAAIVDKGFPIATVDPTTDGDPNTLGFDIQTRDLVEDAATAQNVYAIQFNIIATNKALLTSGAGTGRVVDSLGDQTQIGTTGKGYYRAIIQTSTTYSSSQSSSPEVVGDTVGGTLPAVDLTSWSLTVATP